MLLHNSVTSPVIGRMIVFDSNPGTVRDAPSLCHSSDVKYDSQRRKLALVQRCFKECLRRSKVWCVKLWIQVCLRMPVAWTSVIPVLKYHCRAHVTERFHTAFTGPFPPQNEPLRMKIVDPCSCCTTFPVNNAKLVGPRCHMVPYEGSHCDDDFTGLPDPAFCHAIAMCVFSPFCERERERFKVWWKSGDLRWDASVLTLRPAELWPGQTRQSPAGHGQLTCRGFDGEML